VSRELATGEHVTAGLVSRAGAMVIDAVVVAAAFYGGLALGTLTVQVLLFRGLNANAVSGPFVSLVFGVWTGLYFWAGWSVFGKTLGKALVGLKVVRSDGAKLGWWRALVRLAAFALSAVALGIGFAWVAVDRGRRAWHDILAGTRVVYDWQPHGRPPRLDRAL
jgi:uncharacterized RDD family membrane protein YckC